MTEKEAIDKLREAGKLVDEVKRSVRYKEIEASLRVLDYSSTLQNNIIDLEKICIHKLEVSREWI